MSPTSNAWTRRTVIAGVAAGALFGPAAAEDLPWRLPKLRRTKANGHDIAYFEMGSGPPLVLIHGMSGSPALEWGRVMTPLSRRFRVIAPYQIGFAPSDQPDLPYDAGTFVDSLGGFLAARSAAGATIVGESFGGWVVAQYALAQARTSGRRPPPISRLVIVDGAVQPHAGGGGPANQAQASINSPEVGKLAHDFFVTQPQADNSKTASRVGQHIFAEAVSDDELKTIKTPTLVVWGRGDQLIPVDQGRHIAAQIPGARQVVIDDCGHIPSVEQPRGFLLALGGFLGERLEMLS